jgi:hypothetical protein
MKKPYLFLFILIIVLVLLAEPLFLFWTFVHELGHKNALEKGGISANININFFHWPHGETKPTNLIGCEYFNTLNAQQKAPFYYGGTRYEFISILLVFLFGIVSGAFAFIDRKIVFWWILFGICIISLIILFYSLSSNTNPFFIGSDYWGMMNNIPFDCNKIFE